MVDFIIVGRGLAASVLMHRFRSHDLTFRVVGDPALSSSSAVAAGIWNPVVFKRMTMSWMADRLIPELLLFYREAELQTGKNFVTERCIVKPFTEEQEKVLWKSKAGGELKDFLDPVIHSVPPADFRGLKIGNGFGIVRRAGNLDVRGFMEHTGALFADHIVHEVFDHGQLTVTKEEVRYKHITARNIVFCEGYRVKDNPLFNWIRLNPAKGEVLTIEAPGAHTGSRIFNRNGFLLPLEGKVYKVGATYEWQRLDDFWTAAGGLELKRKIAAMYDGDYSVLSHEAGVRPSSPDRRPIIGPHPEHKNVFIFNGLGAKGVMLAPFFSGNFVLFYLKKEALHPDVNAERFFPDYDSQKK